MRCNRDIPTHRRGAYLFLERYMPAYAAEWAAFVRAVNSGGALPVTLADGIAALLLRSVKPVALADVLKP